MGHVNNKSTEKSTQPSGEEAINPDHYTVIMPNDDSRKPCAICGERFIDFWNDDEEEWMYKNAIMIDDKVLFHCLFLFFKKTAIYKCLQ